MQKILLENNGLERQIQLLLILVKDLVDSQERTLKNFYITARGSLQESKTWLVKAFRRNLISNEEYQDFIKEWDTINFKLINFIKTHSKLMESK